MKLTQDLFPIECKTHQKHHGNEKKLYVFFSFLKEAALTQSRPIITNKRLAKANQN